MSRHAARAVGGEGGGGGRRGGGGAGGAGGGGSGLAGRCAGAVGGSPACGRGGGAGPAGGGGGPGGGPAGPLCGTKRCRSRRKSSGSVIGSWKPSRRARPSSWKHRRAAVTGPLPRSAIAQVNGSSGQPVGKLRHFSAGLPDTPHQPRSGAFSCFAAPVTAGIRLPEAGASWPSARPRAADRVGSKCSARHQGRADLVCMPSQPRGGGHRRAIMAEVGMSGGFCHIVLRLVENR
jgi:hypothetical protein